VIPVLLAGESWLFALSISAQCFAQSALCAAAAFLVCLYLIRQCSKLVKVAFGVITLTLLSVIALVSTQMAAQAHPASLQTNSFELIHFQIELESQIKQGFGRPASFRLIRSLIRFLF